MTVYESFLLYHIFGLFLLLVQCLDGSVAFQRGERSRVRVSGSPLGVFRHPVFHFDPETLLVALEVFGSLDVERVVEVEEVGEKRRKAPDDVFQATCRRPAHPVDGALPEDAQTDVALFADVGVPEAGEALDLRRRDVVIFADENVEPKLAARPVAFVRRDDQGEVVQRVGVFELDFAAGRKRRLHFLNFFDEQFVPDGHSGAR